MKIAVLGTGVVGQTLATKLAELGHSVTIGTRDPDASRARREPTGSGGMPFADWSAEHAGVDVATYANAASGGELVINATSGEATIAALTAAGATNLSGKIIIDVANPLDFSQGMPPSLTVSNTDSLAEQIQRTFPDSKVVKTLNTVTAFVMVNPQSVGGGNHDIFLSGDDAGAKAEVSKLLAQLGWKNIVDLAISRRHAGPRCTCRSGFACCCHRETRCSTSKWCASFRRATLSAWSSLQRRPRAFPTTSCSKPRETKACRSKGCATT